MGGCRQNCVNEAARGWNWTIFELSDSILHNCGIHLILSIRIWKGVYLLSTTPVYLLQLHENRLFFITLPGPYLNMIIIPIQSDFEVGDCPWTNDLNVSSSKVEQHYPHRHSVESVRDLGPDHAYRNTAIHVCCHLGIRYNISDDIARHVTKSCSSCGWSLSILTWEAIDRFMAVLHSS